MNFNDAMDYIAKVNKVGSIYGLERIKILLEYMGNPQQNLSVIHVAGTNGKGSFGAYLGKILQTAGFHVGRYISPAVIGYCERIQIDECWIDEDAVAELLTEIKSVCEMIQSQALEYPTAFEVETAMAFLYFLRQKVDFVILEVGLGGLCDSTNVIEHPLLSVITSVSLDHMAQLGNTLAEIAVQKAGIIKENQDVLVYQQSYDVLNIVEQTCRLKHSRLYQTDWEQIKVKLQSLSSQRFDYKYFIDLETAMVGTYQIYNAVAAVDAALILQEQGINITEQDIYEGIKAARWSGRFEIANEKPLIIVDGAHNPDGAVKLGESIHTYLAGQKVIYLAGVFVDKDYDKILQVLAPWSNVIVTHKPPTDRGLPSCDLAKAARKYYKDVYDCGNIDDGLQEAIALAGKGGAIVAFGSLSTIRGLKSSLKKLDLYSQSVL